MNDEADRNEQINESETSEQINSKIKKYAVALCSCALIFAVLALAVNNSGSKNTHNLPEVTTGTQNVDARVTNVADERNNATMVVPATEITTKMIEVTEAAREETTAEKTTETAKPTSFILPMGTDIGKDYSMGVPVYNSVMSDWRTHDGVDFNGALGDGVKAVADGIVKEIKADALMGDTVVIDHGGSVVATYCGVKGLDSLKKGMIVSKGDKIGELSGVPCESDAEFDHLHLEIKVNGEVSDPLEVMGFYEDR